MIFVYILAAFGLFILLSTFLIVLIFGRKIVKIFMAIPDFIADILEGPSDKEANPYGKINTGLDLSRFDYRKPENSRRTDYSQSKEKTE